MTESATNFIYPEGVKPHLKKFSLGLTHACNLGCRYCYSGRTTKPDMTPDTLGRALDFVWNLTKVGDSLEIGFFGGEPLLRPDLIRQTLTQVKERQTLAPRQVSYQLTTNGTLLNEAMLDLVETGDISVCVSLDGPPKIQDLNRPFRNGQGSSQIVIGHLRLALQRLDSVQVNAVYGPETLQQLPETYLFLQEIGVKSIHLNPDIRADWTALNQATIEAVFHQIAESYIQNFRQNKEGGLNLLDSKILLYLKKGYTQNDRCGMGLTEWAVAASGTVYPCERLIGEDNDPSLQLGNVHHEVRALVCPGSLTPKIKDVLAVAPDCKQCKVQDYCMHWCGCTNFHLTGKADLPGPVICALEKSALKAAHYALETLSAEKNSFFASHIMAFIQPSSSTQPVKE